ncbi:hypothetical protein [Marivita sp.]|uniref:hypothetical protein n=1 Tax=Marivita sp. TaxID=2003365 RepID=UPI003A844E5C
MPAFIKIGDIKGENTRLQPTGKLGTGSTNTSQYTHRMKDVLVSSYNTSASSVPEPGTTKTGVAGRGTLKVNRPTSAYPSPFRAIATGSGRLDTVTLVDNAPGLGPKGTCTFTLSGVKIEDSATKAEPVPTETITMTYEKIEWTYAKTICRGSALFDSAVLDFALVGNPEF